MVHPHLTTHKSISLQPTGQLAPQDVNPPQSQNNTPQLISQEEELFEIEIVVPKS
jgi:hypothetical protein